MDKNEIFNNVDNFSAEQLSDFIDKGIITLDELRDTGELEASKRRAILSLQKNREQEEDNAWRDALTNNTILIFFEYIDKYPNGKYVLDAKNNIYLIEDENAWNIAVNINDILSYSEYLDRYPNGKYTLEAKRRIADLNKYKEELEELLENPSIFPADTIRQYLLDGTITRSQLINKGISENIIDKLTKNESAPDFELGETPNSIPDGFTEVYFWGISGSGKTTALSAVLSTADKNGLLEITDGPGYNYMLQLQNLFSDDISILPTGTPIKTQYLPFTLKGDNEKNSRSVSLIELSGEIFQCFLLKNARQKLTTQKEETFNTLINYLNGNNRKLHFFFVDYNKGNYKDQDGYTQSQYLNGAATFFNNPDYNIFGKTTDAIYVVLTKSDLMPDENKSKKEQVKDYLNDKNNKYVSFIKSLRNKCVQHSINGERIIGIPFSLGSVYFEQICEFNPETAENIIDVLMRRIKPSEKSILDVFNK